MTSVAATRVLRSSARLAPQNATATRSDATPPTSSGLTPSINFVPQSAESERKILQDIPQMYHSLMDHIHKDTGMLFQMYPGKVPSNKEINAFLKSTNLYNSKTKRWVHIPESRESLKSSELHPSFEQILTAILNRFGLSETRQVVNSYNHGIVKNNPTLDDPIEKDNSGSEVASKPPQDTGKHFHPEYNPYSEADGRIELQTFPDFMIAGKSGGSFSLSPTNDIAHPEYLLVATPMDISSESDVLASWGCWGTARVQAALYARLCFATQHNRTFVRCLFLSERSLRLFVFDRVGARESLVLDIHQNAANFVRLILLCSSADESVLGFDTNLVWDGNTRYLNTVDADARPIKFAVLHHGPTFFRYEVFGRGTCCWEVMVDPHKVDGDVFLVKDAWRVVSWTCETDLLEKAKGLDGVGQMIAFEEEKLSVSKLRRLPMGMHMENLNDRVFTRITMKSYGSTLDGFKSLEELLCAFRDAVAGHRNLFRRGILHRDVSIKNILIGKPGAQPGNRGVLIDLDMATCFDYMRCDVNERAVGTIPFQSAYVLKTYAWSKAKLFQGQYPIAGPFHDHMDDLESFYYVLCWIVLRFDGPGRRKVYQPNHQATQAMDLWAARDSCATRAKIGFLSAPFNHHGMDIPAYFEPLTRLLEEYHDLVYDSFVAKMKIKRNNKGLQELRSHAEEHYAAVLKIIDDAIVGLDADSINVEPSCSAVSQAIQAPATPNRVFQFLENVAPVAKRALEHTPEDTPPAKRRKDAEIS